MKMVAPAMRDVKVFALKAINKTIFITAITASGKAVQAYMTPKSKEITRSAQQFRAM